MSIIRSEYLDAHPYDHAAIKKKDEGDTEERDDDDDENNGYLV